jgi:hypothetical protein
VYVNQKLDIDKIVEAYCRMLRKAGHDIASIVGYGPRVAVKTIADILQYPFSELLQFIVEVSKQDRMIVYEKSPLIEGDLKHGFRVHRDLLARYCGSRNVARL